MIGKINLQQNSIYYCKKFNKYKSVYPEAKVVRHRETNATKKVSKF